MQQIPSPTTGKPTKQICPLDQHIQVLYFPLFASNNNSSNNRSKSDERVKVGNEYSVHVGSAVCGGDRLGEKEEVREKKRWVDGERERAVWHTCWPARARQRERKQEWKRERKRERERENEIEIEKAIARDIEGVCVWERRNVSEKERDWERARVRESEKRERERERGQEWVRERARESQAAVGLSSGKFNEVASEGLVWGQSLAHRWPFVALCSPLTPASCLVFKMMVLWGEGGGGI